MDAPLCRTSSGRPTPDQLKASVLEDGELHPNEEGTAQGGFEQRIAESGVSALCARSVVRGRGQAWVTGRSLSVRYIDDFVLCFQYRADALRVQKALGPGLNRFSLILEPSKTKLVELRR